MHESGDESGCVSFSTDGDDVVVEDRIETRSVTLTTSDRSVLRPAMTDMFVFPVDEAVSFTATSLRVGAHKSVRLRDGDGTDLGDFDATPRRVSGGTRFIEVEGPVRLYIRIADASCSVSYAHERTQDRPLDIAFDDPTEIAVGARSAHTRPEATITVPPSPTAMLEALSYLGSSIKEFTAERSWPSIRGHPPAIEVGNRLHVPRSLSKPETGVTIAVPPTYANAYRVAPLAFYLGATVEPGDEPELRLGNGYVEPLRTDGESLAATVEALLGRCFLLDTLVRVGGYYSLPRHEYDELAPHLPFYPPNLYDAPIPDQLIEYLEVSRARIDPHVPEWPATAVLRPCAEDATLLPSVLDTLGPVRVTASAGDGCPDPSPRVAYAHDDPPAGTCRLVPASAEHARSSPPPTPDDTSVAALLADGDRAARLLTLLDDDPVRAGDVTVRDWTEDGATDALSAGHDVLYCDRPALTASFGGAADDPAPSGAAAVDARTVVFAGDGALSAAVDAVEGGGVAGVAAERPLPPRRIRALVGMLVAGNPLSASVRLADLPDDGYRTVGHPSRTAVCLDGGNVPDRIEVAPVAPDEHEITIRHQLTDEQGIGACKIVEDPWSRSTYQLTGASVTQPFRVSAAEVRDQLTDPDNVVRFNGRTYHDETDVSTAFVRDEARRHLRNRR